MKRLNAILTHDNGTIEEVSIAFTGDWLEAFDYLVNVHCKVNTVELTPKNVTLMGSVYEVFDPETFTMVETDDE